MLRTFVFILAVFATSAAYAEENTLPAPNALIIAPTQKFDTIIVASARTVTLSGYNGRHADIVFDRDRVTFSGDLPVDEAAKVFFQAVARSLQGACERKDRQRPNSTD